MTLVEQLVHHVWRDVDDASRRRAALHVADWAATAIGALDTPEATALRDYAVTRPFGACACLGRTPTDSETAAFVNAALSIVLEMDATHRVSKVHPGTTVIAVAVALAQELGSTAFELLDAVVRGYEVSIQIGLRTASAHYRYYHVTSTCAPAGAAVAACSLLGTSEEVAVSAVGNAMSRTGGLWQTRLESTMAKVFHIGEGAASGIRAAKLAQAGLTGPAAVLEGPLGFFAAACPGANDTPFEPVRQWAIHDVSLKPWLGCRHAHPAVQAGLALRSALHDCGIDPTGVDTIEIHTYGEAMQFIDRARPQSTFDGLFSAQHLLAVALLRGVPTLRDVEPDQLHDPTLAALRTRTKLAVDDRYDAVFPERWQARVRVQTDGCEFLHEVEHLVGDPAHPLGPAGVVSKATSLFGSRGQGKELVDALSRSITELPAGHATDLWAALHPSGVG